jgi:hypothetical protein
MASLIIWSIYLHFVDSDAVAQVDAVFGHGGIVWMMQTDVALVFLDIGLDGTAGLPELDMTTLAGGLSPKSSFKGGRKLIHKE